MSASRPAVALASGVLFGAGLAVSGMADPAKVLGFLDLFGRWDPSLALVMATAIPVAWLFYRGAARAGRAVPPPPSARLDARLVLGAAIFGVGWGLVGLCPGPALAGALVAPPGIWIFLAGLLGGVLAHRVLGRR